MHSLYLNTIYLLLDCNHYYIYKQSDPNSSQLLTYIISFLIAFVAPFLAFYQVKSNTISNARIIWIDSLRNNIAEFCSITITTIARIDNCNVLIAKYQTDMTDPRLEVEYRLYEESHTKFIQLSNQIYMSLNSDEIMPFKIQTDLVKISGYLNDKITPEQEEEIVGCLNNIKELAKSIFKEEWEKSKKLFRI